MPLPPWQLSYAKQNPELNMAWNANTRTHLQYPTKTVCTEIIYNFSVCSILFTWGMHIFMTIPI